MKKYSDKILYYIAYPHILLSQFLTYHWYIDTACKVWTKTEVLHWHRYGAFSNHTNPYYSSVLAVLTLAPSCFPTQLMLQPANQATRLLTLGNASPCRAFPTGGHFPQVTAWRRRVVCLLMPPLSTSIVLIICSLISSLLTTVSPSSSSASLDIVFIISRHLLQEQQCLLCLCPFCFSLNSPVT